ncbi:MAG: hypothetical protein GY913_27890 [Proteobacteria bacterium]|nr:hypothetical protein [Pseudomonadota bacterium]
MAADWESRVHAAWKMDGGGSLTHVQLVALFSECPDRGRAEALVQHPGFLLDGFPLESVSTARERIEWLMEPRDDIRPDVFFVANQRLIQAIDAEDLEAVRFWATHRGLGHPRSRELLEVIERDGIGQDRWADTEAT